MHTVNIPYGSLLYISRYLFRYSRSVESYKKRSYHGPDASKLCPQHVTITRHTAHLARASRGHKIQARN